MLKRVPLFFCLGIFLILEACAWKQVSLQAPVPFDEIPAVVQVFNNFGEYIEAEQRQDREVPLEEARNWGLGFLIDLHKMYEGGPVYTAKYREGYEALDMWWKKDLLALVKKSGLETGTQEDYSMYLYIGRHLRTPKDYEALRYYEVTMGRAEITGHPLYEEMVKPRERKEALFEKLKIIALRNIILDVRRTFDADGLEDIRYEEFGGRFGRYFVDIFNAVLGNGPANMAPTPKVQ